MDSRVLIALISVSVGWFLAQSTETVKHLYLGRKLRRGLLAELEDIRAQLQRSILIYRRQLQIHVLKGIEPAAPLAVPNLFFKQYYKDVFSRLNREQRLSLQLIHGTLDALNEENGRFLEFTRETIAEFKRTGTLSDAQSAAWGERVIVLHSNARVTLWHIELHLKNPRNPDMDPLGPTNKAYREFLDSVDKDIRELMEAAKHLKREAFERSLGEKLFP